MNVITHMYWIAVFSC